jgi:hypothetical protein
VTQFHSIKIWKKLVSAALSACDRLNELEKRNTKAAIIISDKIIAFFTL